MVKSKLDDTINYPELKKINEDDSNFDATVYEVPILKRNVIIALGKSKYTFVDKNIEYFPIYLVKNNKVVSQIGVYEVYSNDVPNILDEDGDVDIDLLNEPLIFSFIQQNERILDDNRVKTNEKIEYVDYDSSEGEEEDTEEMDSEDSLEIVEKEIETKGIETKEKKLQFSELNEQTKEDSERDKNEYVHNQDSEWIQEYLKSNHYDIIDNEGKGDCFFAVIRDGLARAGVRTSVQELRDKLSDSINDNIFQGYLEMYNMFNNEVKTIKDKMLTVINENKKLKKELDKTIDKKMQIAIIERGKILGKQFESLDHDKRIAESQLQEFNSMKDIKTIDKFKDLVKTCRFWADTWAISTIERLTNIKIILFSFTLYIL